MACSLTPGGPHGAASMTSTGPAFEAGSYSDARLGKQKNNLLVACLQIPQLAYSNVAVNMTTCDAYTLHLEGR